MQRRLDKRPLTLLHVQVEKSRHPEHAGDPEHLPWLAEVDTCGGVDKLEELQNHEDEEVYIKAVSHEHHPQTGRVQLNLLHV